MTTETTIGICAGVFLVVLWCAVVFLVTPWVHAAKLASPRSVSALESKCAMFADAKAAAGGTRHLLFSSCMQFGGDPADAWLERMAEERKQ